MVIRTVLVPGIVAVVIHSLGPIFLSGTLMPLVCVSTILVRLLLMSSYINSTMNTRVLLTMIARPLRGIGLPHFCHPLSFINVLSRRVLVVGRVSMFLVVSINWTLLASPLRGMRVWVRLSWLELRPGDQGALAVIPVLSLFICLPRSHVILAAMSLCVIPVRMIVVIISSLIAIRISAPLLLLVPLHFLIIL